jgi:hypothetical protein
MNDETVDHILIEQALLYNQIKTIEATVFNLASYLLDDDKLTSLQQNHYHTLALEKDAQSSLHELLDNPHLLTKALFEQHTYIQSKLRDLKS